MMNSTGPAGVADAALSVLERHGVAWEQVGNGRVALTADGLRHPVNVQSHTLLVRALWWTPDSGALVAPTPLIYADLLASDDPRQIEIAAELRRTDALLRRLDEA